MFYSGLEILCLRYRKKVRKLGEVVKRSLPGLNGGGGRRWGGGVIKIISRKRMPE